MPIRPASATPSGDSAGDIPNMHHPDVMRGILEGILSTGDVIGTGGPGRTVLAVTVDDWLFDALAGFGADLEDCERWRSARR